MLYYKGKSRNIDENIEASMHLYAPIEIIPFDQNRFDIIKLSNSLMLLRKIMFAVISQIHIIK